MSVSQEKKCETMKLGVENQFSDCVSAGKFSCIRFQTMIS